MPKKGHGYYGDLGDSPLAQWLYKHKPAPHSIQAINVRRVESSTKDAYERKKEKKKVRPTLLLSGRPIV